MTTNHTPGPWYAISSDVYKDIGGQRYLVAHVGGWGCETQPNARLIAAAPDLLAALEAIAGSAQPGNLYTGPDGWKLAHDKFVAYARAVIAKAKGE